MSRFYHIRLELAREAGRPHGDAHEGYDIVAPLDESGHLDPVGWKRERRRCRVRRFVKDQTLSLGSVNHGPGGRWTLDMAGDGKADSIAGFHLGDEAFAAGEYVSLTEPGGRQHTYVIARMAEV